MENGNKLSSYHQQLILVRLHAIRGFVRVSFQVLSSRGSLKFSLLFKSLNLIIIIIILHMAKFDWVPYLEGKYLNYYQWFAAIGSFVCFVLSLISAILYLIICKLASTPTQHKWTGNKKKLIERLKNVTFNGAFVFLTIIPLICSALDVIYLV